MVITDYRRLNPNRNVIPQDVNAPSTRRPQTLFPGAVFHTRQIFFSVFSFSFCRATLRKRGLCRHAVSVRPSVCPSITFVDSVKMNKHIFIFLPSGSHIILVFRTKRLSNIPRVPPPLTGASNAGVVN